VFRRRSWAALVALAPLIAACASASADPGWERYELTVAGRVLAAASPSGQGSGPTLTVFIEGDGAAHDAAGRPSGDPTPNRPVSLQIAQAWPSTGPRAWLGRLCQHVMALDRSCAPDDWTRSRFSPTAVAAANAALDLLKARAGSERLVLIGWSGGGTLATLVAASRDDVEALTTIAAPLDLAAWTKRMGISPLPHEGDPSRIVWRQRPLQQVHLFGGRDLIVPAADQAAAARRLGGTALVWPGERHTCCWVRKAPEIAALIRPHEP
jgi:pimeloyl-ACP methyl ester carboxylesterase